MTACNVILRKDCGSIFADAGRYDMQGRIQQIESKIATPINTRAAFVVRGVGGDTSIINRAMKNKLSIAEVVAVMPDLCRDINAYGRTACQLLFGRKLANSDHIKTTLTAIVWDEQADLPRYLMVGCDRAILDPENPFIENNATAFTVIEAGVFCLQPAIETPIEDLTGFPVDGFDDIFKLDHREHGRKFLAEQHNRKVEMKGIGAISIVGGFGEMVQVSKTGVTRETLISWPDKIGDLAGAHG